MRLIYLFLFFNCNANYINNTKQFLIENTELNLEYTMKENFFNMDILINTNLIAKKFIEKKFTFYDFCDSLNLSFILCKKKYLNLKIEANLYKKDLFFFIELTNILKFFNCSVSTSLFNFFSNPSYKLIKIDFSFLKKIKSISFRLKFNISQNQFYKNDSKQKIKKSSKVINNYQLNNNLSISEEKNNNLKNEMSDIYSIFQSSNGNVVDLLCIEENEINISDQSSKLKKKNKKIKKLNNNNNAINYINEIQNAKQSSLINKNNEIITKNNVLKKVVWSYKPAIHEKPFATTRRVIRNSQQTTNNQLRRNLQKKNLIPINKNIQNTKIHSKKLNQPKLNQPICRINNIKRCRINNIKRRASLIKVLEQYRFPYEEKTNL